VYIHKFNNYNYLLNVTDGDVTHIGTVKIIIIVVTVTVNKIEEELCTTSTTGGKDCYNI
jgi:hypothetical protein